MLYIVIFFTSAMLGTFGAFWVIKAASSFPGVLDIPNERSSHFVPTPRGGGIGLAIVLVLMSLFSWGGRALAVLGSIMAVLGLMEDMKGLPVSLRLASQSFLAILAAWFFLPSYLAFTYLVLFLFFCFFIVWTTNLYNFMDGIDGMAGLTALAGFAFTGYYAWRIANIPDIAIICVAMSAASLGFLFFNFPKAKVFIGDVGSVTLGFVFAVMVVKLSSSFLDFLCLGAFMFTFYADELVTMTLRIKSRENLLKAHRSHFYQILANEVGIVHWKVSLGYFLVQVTVGVSALYLMRFGAAILFLALFTYFIGFVLLNYKVRKSL